MGVIGVKLDRLCDHLLRLDIVGLAGTVMQHLGCQQIFIGTHIGCRAAVHAIDRGGFHAA